jgi:hypothetical protein
LLLQVVEKTAPLALRVRKDQLVQPESKVPLVKMALRAQQAQRAQRAQLALTEPLEPTEPTEPTVMMRLVPELKELRSRV